MKRELKRQIKQNELVTGIDRTIQWMLTHQRELRVTAIVVLAAVAGWLALGTYRGSRSRAAEEAFAEALRVYHAPVAGDPDAADSGAPKVYATEAEKHQEACTQFSTIHRRYASHRAGRRARYYEGLCRQDLGQLDEAEKAFQEVAAQRDKDALEPALARLAAADLARRRGKMEQALSAYRQMADDAGLALPRDHVLMSLSAALEEAQRLKEAQETYRRLAEEFPGSVYAAEARRRAEFLKEPAAG